MLAAALAFLAFCALTNVAQPGLRYDEMLFINAALGGHYPWHEFILKELAGVPSMLHDVHRGADGVGVLALSSRSSPPSTIRGPMIVAAIVSIAGVFWLARRLLGAWFGVALAVVLATEPVCMTVTKADWGPAALVSLLRVGALLAYFARVRTTSVDDRP